MSAAWPWVQTPRRLRLALAVLLLAVLVPAALLVREAWHQVRWEGLHQQQLLARELVASINRSLERLGREEAGIAFEAYRFAQAGEGTVVQRSPLSELPGAAALPGLLGRFQLAADGGFSTPLLPAADPRSFGLDESDYRQRAAVEAQVFRALQARPVPAEETAADPGAPPPPRAAEEAAPKTAAAGAEVPAAAEPVRRESARASAGTGPSLFDRLEEGAASLSSRAGRPAGAAGSAAGPGTDREADLALGESAAGRGEELAARFDGERLRGIDAAPEPLSLLLLDNATFVLFRRRFEDGQRYLQGAALARDVFLEGLLAQPFRESAVSAAADLSIAWGGAPLAFVAGREPPRRVGYDPGGGALEGELIHAARLVAPFDGLRLSFLARDIPPGPGGPVVAWTGGALLLLTLAGFYVLYRAGLRQLELARQQQDFVSAVSHELRTPLTSIRMYSEMLRAGWADEARRREYYDFIHAESERLSRLVANVLRLSRMNRAGLELSLAPATLGELLAELRPGLAQVAQAGGFTLEVACPAAIAGARVEVDRDALHQVLLNLVDNAVKFAGGAQDRRLLLTAAGDGPEAVTLELRDFGPGLPPGDPERLFGLFHRPRPEGSRAPGTGIGLALVRALVEGMGGTVRAADRRPGAAFVLRLPRLRGAGS